MSTFAIGLFEFPVATEQLKKSFSEHDSQPRIKDRDLRFKVPL